MEEGITSSSSYPHRRKFREQFDRFIPFRSAMDFDYASTVFTGKKGKKNPSPVEMYSPSREAYRKLLVETFNMDRTRRILAFKNKQQDPVKPIPTEFLSPPLYQFKAPRYIPKAPEQKLDATGLVDDHFFNLLDWGSNNVVSIALGNTVYLRDASDGTTSELLTVDEDVGPVTSVRWAPDGSQIAVGLNNSQIQIWDSTANKLERTLRGGHHSYPVAALDWNNRILTSGGMNGQIINTDVRAASHVVGTYKGHHQEVCGLRWSANGCYLASGGNDNLVHIWDRSSSRRLHRLDDHTAAVRALAWCPFQSNLLASGGGVGDNCIRFWNMGTGACLNSIHTGSEVGSLMWNKNERELLSSHGGPLNQLTLWRYPSMLKIAEFTCHTSRVLFMAQSPDGCTIASAGDEILGFWNIFPARKRKTEPFSNFNCIR